MEEIVISLMDEGQTVAERDVGPDGLKADKICSSPSRSRCGMEQGEVADTSKELGTTFANNLKLDGSHETRPQADGVT